MNKSQLAEAAALLGTLAQREVAIGPMTTYRVGGRAALYAEVASQRDVELVCRAVAASAIPVLVVGKGSNLLVADAGFGGLVLHLSDAYGDIAIEGTRLVAGAAAAYPVVARRSAAAALEGMEWAVGIPGSVGGAVRMNAGGHGAETKDRLVFADVVDLSAEGPQPVRLSNSDLDYSYRRSSIGPSHLVMAAAYELVPGEAAESSARISEIVRWRRENQPGGQNAGSVFTNPPGDSAGRIIDSIGMKGFRIGTAAVSEKHANFIQADPAGSADDVRAVIEAVRQAVADRTGQELAVEVRMIGWTDGGTPP